MKKIVVVLFVVMTVVLSVFAIASAIAVDSHIGAGTSRASRFEAFSKLMNTNVEYSGHQGMFDIPAFMNCQFTLSEDEKTEYRTHEGIYNGLENFRTYAVKYTEHHGQYDMPEAFRTAPVENGMSIEGLLTGNRTREDVYAALEANGNFFCSNNNNYLLCKAKDAGKFETITYYFSGDELQSIGYNVMVK